MKRLLYITFALILWACSTHNADEHTHMQGEAKQKTYTCPMHPEILRNKPGQCPICGMDLVEKTEGGEEIADSSLEDLLKPADTYVSSQVKTTRMIESKHGLEIIANGTITYDPRAVNIVSARVSGRIEKLYLRYKFHPVKKGDKLMEIYSKELLTEQENYLFLLQNDRDNSGLIAAAENRLELSGLTKKQIDELRKTGKVQQAITIFSPYDGHLHDLVPMEQGGGEMAPSANAGPMLLMHEGMYVEKGQALFNIYDTRQVWAVLNVPTVRQQLVAEGDTVELAVDGVAEPVLAKINFVEPQLNERAKSVPVRVYLDNRNDELKIGAIVSGRIHTKALGGNFLPAMAVVSLGRSSVVFVKRGSLFEARRVTEGVRGENEIQIVEGLLPSEEVAANAQLLVDSEAFIRLASTEKGSNAHDKSHAKHK